MACIDWAAGVLLAELRRLGLEDDTIVIFTSDNGSRSKGEGGSNAPLRGTKGDTWEGGMRVPCLVRWPGHVEAGAVSSVLATAMDLFPTLARIAEADLPSDRIIDGRDITPVLLGGTAGPHEAFYYYRGNGLEAVRSGGWKLYVARLGVQVDELYDLVDDVGETNNVFAHQPGVVAQLGAHVGRARADLGDARLGITGSAIRPVGRVDRAVTLTTFDPHFPYYLAEYDLIDRG